ncbi:MAG TPA: tRNA pseudouridine(38-40) synthase TruA [Ignavibacteriales bacterium]|nr:tRNA pseudouridine(38-40) synthase TruA [Ignavibacteriales bacterium]
MNNYKLLIQYDGTDYAGWQIQNNAVSVQSRITEAIEVLLKEKINLIGAGRTDAGVHALGQTANFRTEADIDIWKFRYSLNALLPKDIFIPQIEPVPENFHSRFDANKRSYLYIIMKERNPFYYKYASVLRNKLDVDRLNRISSALIGEHDFSSFGKKLDEKEHGKCILHFAHWKETKGFIIFNIEANRFLRGMVRSIVGTLTELCDNNMTKESITEILSAKNRDAAGMSAPPQGLFLYKVKY